MEMGKDCIRYPGFKFSPTEEELILYYLRRKLDGFQKCVQVIAEIDINQHEPWDLPEKSVIWSDNEWFFFSTRRKKYPQGFQSRRTTESGYWKATGRERNVKSGARVVGTKRTLVFYKGRPPKGERTEWIMHEYCMVGVPQDSLIVCRVRKIGEFKDDIIPQQLDQAGESNDLQQKDTFDGPISNDSKYRDKFQGFKKGYSNPHSVECHSESEYGQKPENLIFYDESCSSSKFQGYDGITYDCFASILDDDIIKLHGSSLSSSCADLPGKDMVKDNFSDYKLEQPTEGVPLATLSSNEIENLEIRIKQKQRPPEAIPPATLPFQGTANRRIRLNWQHKKKPITPVTQRSCHMT
nr:PREDICTED: LOW QUALITY PROTEIN: NAC domain-containing protein 40 [Daucus carota subsp. sativus]